MKKFQFQLEKLLSYKGQMLDSEMMTLAVLNTELQRLEGIRARLKEEQEKCKCDFEEKIKEKTTPAACQLYLSYKQHLKEQMEFTENELVSMAAQVEEQIDKIKGLKLETKSLETIKATRLDEYNKEDLKLEELRLEEYISTAKIISHSF